MDAKVAQVVPSEPLKYQTWFLKVSIHCEGCRRKVKKVLQSIDGVFTTTIDPQQHKVTVTGSVGVETLLRKLLKAGKHAEIWPENLAGNGKGNPSSKAKKKNEKATPESAENHAATNAEPNLCSGKNGGIESAERYKDESKKSSNSKTTAVSPGKSPEGFPVPEPVNKGGQSEGEGSGKKKKKKGQGSVCGSGNNGNGLSCSASKGAPAHTGLQPQCSSGQVVGQVNLSPTRQQQAYMYPESCYYPPLVYLATYKNRLCPMGTMNGPSYYVPPLPYMCSGLDHDPCYRHMQSPPLVSFEIFSDENANGCSIM
ncbi:hypothetical protein RJT34_32236 [Clitoria ternatea]|uniref:HMA domain-containing protein n=1 Tax=Clitoria ternatea TaxID=43366 RepID=A0AAN9EW16_CLITE